MNEPEIKIEPEENKKEEEKKTHQPVSLSHSLQLFIENNPDYIICPNEECGNVFERLPPNEADLLSLVRDENGALILGAALENYHNFRFRCRECDAIFCSDCRTIPYHLGYDCEKYQEYLKADKFCHFCHATLPEKHPPFFRKVDTPLGEEIERKKIEEEEQAAALKLGNLIFICEGEECKQKSEAACLKFLPCGHVCHGVANEAKCLRCLHEGCCEKDGQNGDDFCNICWIEGLNAAPSIQLECGHIFHFTCVKEKLSKKWPGAAITFAFMDCPLCNKIIEHPALEAELKPMLDLKRIVSEQALKHLSAEGYQDDPPLKTIGSSYFEKPQEYASHIFVFHLCYWCKIPYFGGKKECQGEVASFDPKELVCGHCSGLDGGNCKIHGAEFVAWKCRFCCSLATFFCGGKAHFCTPCHNTPDKFVEFSGWTTIPSYVPVPCAGGDACPLKINHPLNGSVEYALECAMCRQADKTK